MVDAEISFPNIRGFFLIIIFSKNAKIGGYSNFYSILNGIDLIRYSLAQGIPLTCFSMVLFLFLLQKKRLIHSYVVWVSQKFGNPQILSVWRQKKKSLTSDAF